MSTSFAMAYQKKSDAKVRSCVICGHDFEEYACSAHYGPIGDKACYWCLSRKNVYARFNKLIAALQEMDGAHYDDEISCGCPGHQALNGILRALT